MGGLWERPSDRMEDASFWGLQFSPDRRRPTCCSSLPGSPGQRESPALGMCQRANAEDTRFEAGLGPVGNCTCKPVTHLLGLSERDLLLFL